MVCQTEPVLGEALGLVGRNICWHTISLWEEATDHKLRFRQVHLDFHTSEQIAGIGPRFDADKFPDNLALAHFDSLTWARARLCM